LATPSTYTLYPFRAPPMVTPSRCWIPTPCSELIVPDICLGTMTFGEQTSEADAHAQLDYALEHGINFIDTAEMYAVPPRAETCGALGEHRRPLARPPAAGKDHSGHQGRRPGTQSDLDTQWPAGDGPEQHPGGHRRFAAPPADRLHRSLSAALAGTQSADVRPVAVRPDKERECTTIREQLEALAELVREGKIRHVGVSNEHPWGIMQLSAWPMNWACRASCRRKMPTICSTVPSKAAWPKSATANGSACSPIHRSPLAT
jgi:hypothetical protein